MAPIGDKELSVLAEKGLQVLRVGRSFAYDFLEQLNLKITFEKAYFDPYDGLPVTVLKLETSKVAQNAAGELHTGALCTMFDHLSTFSVFADPGWWDVKDGDVENAELVPHISDRLPLEVGLSRNIKMHLQRPVTAGSTVYFVTKILENTPRTTYFFSQIFDTDGILHASGHHDKVKLTKIVKPKL